MQSFSSANQMYVRCVIDLFEGSVTVCAASVFLCVCVCMYLCMCVCMYLFEAVCESNQCGGDGGRMSLVRTAVNTAGVQLPSRGWAGPC